MQADVYDKCVETLVEGALKGYNATVLAYGQVRRPPSSFLSYSLD